MFRPKKIKMMITKMVDKDIFFSVFPKVSKLAAFEKGGIFSSEIYPRRAKDALDGGI